MDNRTFRWITNLLLCVDTGFMVTAASVLTLGDHGRADTILYSATMLVCSVIVVVVSYLIAMQELN